MKEIEIKQLTRELENYKVAYDILMDYWDYIPNEDKEEVHERLFKVGL